jgi:hypothetical protein
MNSGSLPVTRRMAAAVIRATGPLRSAMLGLTSKMSRML